MIGLYLTHPQVAIDPTVPVPDWPLSAKGRERVVAVLDRPWLEDVQRIVASEERKAIETADLLAAKLGFAAERRADMGENDRSATGFIPPDKFEAAADAFFAEPQKSWRGWERAVDAQRRIVGAVQGVLHDHDPAKGILFVGHGAVGTLLKCHLAGRPIARREDQPGGGGNIFAFRLSDRKLLCDWTPIETFEGVRHDA